MHNFILGLYKYLVGAGAGTALGCFIGLIVLPVGWLTVLLASGVFIGSFISISVFKERGI